MSLPDHVIGTLRYKTTTEISFVVTMTRQTMNTTEHSSTTMTNTDIILQSFRDIYKKPSYR